MENNMTYVQEEQEKKTNLIGGIVGALIGALIGAVVWTAIGMLGYIVGLVGLLIAFLASKGYDLLKGPQGVVKMVVLCICVVLAVGAGTVGTYVLTAHNTYQEEINSLSDFEKQYYEITPEDEFIALVLSDEEVQSGMIKDGGMGLVFGFLGSYGFIFGASAAKKKNAAQVETDLESARVTPVDEVPTSIEAAAVPAVDSVEATAKEDVQA